MYALVNANAFYIPLTDNSVHCVVTSPPYFNLRQYEGTTTWLGGSADCDHVEVQRNGLASGLRNDGRKHQGLYDGEKATRIKRQYKDVCLKCGAMRIDKQVGNEETPEAYVRNIVAIFREIKRVLHPSGVVFLNLGDSYYGSGGAHSNDKNPGISRSYYRDGVPRGRSYGIGDKGESNYPNRDYPSQNPYDVRRDLDNYRNFGNDLDRAPKQAHEFCLKTLEYIEDLNGHLPIEDYGRQKPTLQFLRATLDHLQIVAHEGEQLRVSLASTIDVSSRQQEDYYRLLDSFSACLLSLHSLIAYVYLFADKLDEVSSEHDYIQGNATLCEGLAYHIQCTYECCFSVLSWLKVIYIQPYCTTKLKPKDMIGIPWRVAFALREDGWYLRSDIIWNKPNPMPESTEDRPTRSHEYLFLLSKSPRYYYDWWSIKEDAVVARGKSGFGGPKNNDGVKAHTNDWGKAWDKTPYRNKRSVWEIATQPYPGSHYATYPEELIEPCVKAGTSEHGCCPKCGAPWRRILEKEKRPAKEDKIAELAHLGIDRHSANLYAPHEITPARTIGWEPSCKCGIADRKPCIVLDPFAGSGTTLVVARRLGRHAIGLDLSLQYLKDNARQRLELDKLDEWQNGIKDNSSLEDLPLFGGMNER